MNRLLRTLLPLAALAFATALLVLNDDDPAEAALMANVSGSASTASGRVYDTTLDLNPVLLPPGGTVDLALDFSESDHVRLTGNVHVQCEGGSNANLVSATCTSEITNLIVWVAQKDIMRAGKIKVTSSHFSTGDAPRSTPAFEYDDICVRYYDGREQCEEIGLPQAQNPAYAVIYPGLEVPINTNVSTGKVTFNIQQPYSSKGGAYGFGYRAIGVHVWLDTEFGLPLNDGYPFGQDAVFDLAIADTFMTPPATPTPLPTATPTRTPTASPTPITYEAVLPAVGRD